MSELMNSAGQPQTNRLPDGCVELILPAIVLAAGIYAQSLTFINHDVAWTIYAGEVMLNGGRYGTDIIDPNPPLVWWFAIIPNALARSLDISAVEAFRLTISVLIAVSLTTVHYFLRQQDYDRFSRIAFVSLAAFFLTIFIHRDFGQREHLAVILSLPYVIAVAHRLDGRTMPIILALAIGSAAGLGIAIKPYFGFVPLLLESYLLWKKRNWAHLLRPEAVGAIGAVVSYLAIIYFVATPYLMDVVPDGYRIYWAFSSSIAQHYLYLLWKFAAVVLGVAFVLRRGATSQAIALSLAGIGFVGAMILQSEYFSYHIYPGFVFLLLALVLGLFGLAGFARYFVLTILLLVLVQNAVDARWQIVNRTRHGAFGADVDEIAAVVRARVPRDGSFTAISTHPYPGFPTVLYAGRRWTSLSISRLYLPAIVKLRKGQRNDPGLLAFAERKAREDMMRDMAKQPEIILVDTARDRFAIGRTRFDFLAFYLEEPQFRRDWKSYEKIDGQVGGFDVYIRKDRQAGSRASLRPSSR